MISKKLLNAIGTVLFAGLVVGVLDGLDAVVFFGVRGVSADRVFRFVGSALIGPAAKVDNIWTVSVGVIAHFAVATSLAATYYICFGLLPILARFRFCSGVVFGLISYVGMNYVVLPLTRASASNSLPPWPILLNGVLAHVFLVGIPIAWITFKRTRSSGPLSYC